MKILEAFIVQEWSEDQMNQVKRDDFISQDWKRAAENKFEKAKSIFEKLANEFIESN